MSDIDCSLDSVDSIKSCFNDAVHSIVGVAVDAVLNNDGLSGGAHDALQTHNQNMAQLGRK